MAAVKVTTDVKIVAIVLGVAVLLAVLTIVIVAFLWRPKKRISAEDDGQEGGDGRLSSSSLGPAMRPESLAVESRELEDRSINRDGSNQAPLNMVPKYD